MSEVGETLSGSCKVEMMPLSDLYGLGSAICIETKCFLIGSMEPGVNYGTTALRNNISDIQGPEPSWEQSSGTTGSHLEDSFVEEGLVTVSIDPNTGYSTYAISEKGVMVAKPLAGHLVHLSLEIDQPLEDVLGPRKSNSPEGLRPIQRRLEVMQAVVSNSGKGISIHEISQQIGADISHTQTIVDDLKRAELIDVESVGRGRVHKTFSPTEKFYGYKLRSHTSQFMKNIINALDILYSNNENQPVSQDQVKKALLELPEYETTADFGGKLSTKLNQLSRYSGILSISSSNDEDKSRAIVRADNDQLLLMDRILTIFKRAQEGDCDYVSEGIDKLKKILNNANDVNILMAKAREASQGLKALRSKMIARKILLILAMSGTELSNREIRDTLQTTGDKLDKQTVVYHTRKLASLGKISTLQTNEGHKYSVYI